MESKVAYMNNDLQAPNVSICCYLHEVAISKNYE
jgi:hypothetical protein